MNGYGGWRRREFEGRSSGDYSKWPAIARALKEGAPDPAEEWTPVPEQVDLTKMPGYSMGYAAGYGEAQKDIGKKPQPGDLLSTDEEVRVMIHGATPGGLQPTSRPSGDPPASLPPPNKHPKLIPGEAAVPDPAEEWQPTPEQVDLTKMPGYQMGHEARQPEVDRLREFALETWAYVKAHWDGTRQYADLLEEARALGIVEAPPDA